jgi:hypothetical protein
VITEHVINQIKHPGLRGDNTLHVIGVVSNPARFHSRYRLMREWIKATALTPCVHLTIVEAAYGDREFEIIDDPTLPCDVIGVRIKSNAWIKESMINLAFRHLTAKYQHAKYFAWIDGDVFFNNPDWAQETIHALQTFEVIQPWSEAIDLGPHDNIMATYKSFGYQHQRRIDKQKGSQPYCELAHTGFAWACTRKFAEVMIGAGGSNGPMIDWALLGSGDHNMAWAMIGDAAHTVHGMVHPSFLRKCIEWQNRAVKVTNGEVGYIPGFLKHKFHGPKHRRFYKNRWDILIEKEYDPDKNLVHDEQGIVTVVGNHKLEHAIYLYNNSRMEDSIEQ